MKTPNLETRQPWASRLSPPPAPRYEVQRTEVSEQIFAAGGAKVVLISASAGFGKTTVMRQVWRQCENGGVARAWLTLDRSDNDIGRLLNGLAAALEAVMPGILDEETLIDSVGRTSVAVLERIARHGEPFVLFLDDFEALQSTAVLSLVRQLIQSLPAGGQLVIGSRISPDIGMPRLRASGALLEIDLEQLRFTFEETSGFLQQGQGLRLSAEDIGRLYTRTEGWPVALWMASLSLSERARPSQTGRKKGLSEFIDSFSGSHAGIAEYLAEDVLSRQTPEIREFLIKTSILGSFSADLCDCVLERTDSEELLEQLERSNLFIVPLDSQRSTYRYHGLFAEFLMSQLKRKSPQLIPRLHRKASEWYLTRHRPVPAIDHALLSGDVDYALSLLESEAAKLLDDGRMRLLARWLGSVPPSQLKGRTALEMVHAWAISFTSGPHEAMTLVQGFDERKRMGVEAAAHLLTLKIVLLLRMDRIDEAYELGVGSFERLPEQLGFVRGMFAIALGTSAMMLGKFTEAQHYFAEARRVQAPQGMTFVVAMSESAEGAMDLLRGQLQQAVSRLRRALEPRSHGPARYAKANALAGVLLAEALYEADEREEAERLLNGYLPFIQEGGLPDQLISGHVLLARLMSIRGNVEQAFQIIIELEYVGHRLQLPRVAAAARLERAQLALNAGNIEAAGDELQFAANDPLWASVNRLHMVANNADTYDIVRLRWLLRGGNAPEVILPLSKMLETAQRERRTRRILTLQLLLAEAFDRTGDERTARQHLIDALSVGFRENFVRIFADEGGKLMSLVQNLYSSHAQLSPGITKEYLDRILAAGGKLPQEANRVERDAGAEVLTRKEIAVLQLVAEGLSNRALAQKLFLSETTIRTHLRNINSKLGVHSRVQAIIAARRHGYLA